MAAKIDLNEMYDKIKSIGKMNAGIVTTKQIEEIGIYRGMICKFVNDGRLVKEAKGIYSLADEFPDEYALLQKRSEKIIFSYGTALYLWGMSDRIPHTISVTVPQGFNCTRIKKDFVKIKFHYVKKDIWNLGITNTDTAMGNKVMLYDKERCICDLIMVKNEVNKQLYVQAIKEYFNADYNIRKLIKYAKLFEIEEKVRDYVEILT
ncbi:MAG: type IV toxin-antitoxin system AbiEi family antitoxin domain-containing protein [Clostridiales bacterium]|nr:type IV toxin-antitoxin system AbiEi family antitoxin domain-containing protein [Clostridiales bacterium]MDD6292306.1 abortive infection protein [Eubacteriales bacterium]